MRNLHLMTAFLALVGLGAATAMADQTNVVQNLGIHLVGFKQAQPVTNGNIVNTRLEVVRIGTPDVIGALGAAAGVTLSPAATLVVVTPLGGGDSSFQVRDSGNVLDVTRFFSLQVISGSLESSRVNLGTGRGSGSIYSVQGFSLVDAAGANPLTLHFDLRGVATEDWTNSRAQGLRTDSTLEATGSGDSGGALLILR